LGTVSMNMPESNHIFADLGIPYMDTVTGSFAAQTPAKTQFSPLRSANFSLSAPGPPPAEVGASPPARIDESHLGPTSPDCPLQGGWGSL
jgi:hypothetical protein